MSSISEHAQLPLVAAEESSQSWLNTVRVAIINTRGVFAITDFMEDLTWRNGGKLSRKVLKAYLGATLHNPWELHPGLDFHQGERYSASKLKTVSAVSMERHVDRGLLNIVQASAIDRWDLHIDLGSGLVDALDLTKAVARDNKLLIVIPGYTLHVFEPKLQAPAHEIRQDHGSHSRSTRVFQCRLPNSFQIRGQPVGFLLAKSFIAKSEEQCFEVTVQETTGQQLVFEVTSDMSVADLKQLYDARRGIRPEDARLIFNGRVLQEGQTLGEMQITVGSLVKALSTLRGD